MLYSSFPLVIYFIYSINSVCLCVYIYISCCCSLSKSWTATRQASLSFTISWSLLKLMSIESVIPSNHLIFCHPLFLLPSIFPSIRVLSNESALCIRWPKYWSFSISPSSEYSGLISFRIYCPCCPRDSQEFSPAPQFKRINSLVFSLLYGPIVTSVHDYWKKHSFDYMVFCWQSDVSASYLSISISHSNFKVYNIVMLTIVTMLSIHGIPRIYSFHNWKLYPLTCISTTPP